MGRLGTREQPQKDPALAEGYPTLNEVLALMRQDDSLPSDGVRRVEVNLFASGEATYQVWTVYAEEADGGYLTNT